MRGFLGALGLVLVFPAARPSGLAAQNDPRLVAAVRLAQDGLSDSARAVVGRLLAATQPTDTLYPEVLYTVGLLAATEFDRRLNLRRVLVDYAQSAWADDALLQLAQLDYVGGNPAGTVRQVDQLLRDYPASPLTAIAGFWGARAAGDRHDASAACRMADLGLGAVGNDVELRNQLEFQKTRCQSLAALVADSIRVAVADSVAKARADSIARAHVSPPSHRTPLAPSRPTGTPPAGARGRVQPSSRSGFYIQISAVLSQTAATAEADRIKRAGFSTIAMKEGGYLKMRTGPFRTRPEAETAVSQVKARLGGHPFVVRVP